MTPTNTATVVLFFNKPAMTKRCLLSVMQSMAPCSESHKIYVVDNGSIRPSGIIDLSSDHDSVVETIRLDTNQGFARGMNAGLRAAFSHPATARAVALSNDIEIPADFHPRLEALPPFDGILCPHVYHLADRARASYTHGALELATGSLSHHFDANTDEIVFPRYYPAAATVWSRSAFERLGGFDESYFCYWEDVDLSWRATRAGVTLRPVPELRVHHQGRGTTGGKRVYTDHFRKGQELTMARLKNALV